MSSPDPKRLNILVAAHMPCVPQTNGYSIRVYSLYSRLAKKHNLTWILPVNYGPVDDPLFENLIVAQPRHRLKRRAILFLKQFSQNSRWFRVFSTYALHPAFFARPGLYYYPEIDWFRNVLREQANSGKFDLLMVEHELLGEFIPHNIRIPSMLIMQNIPTAIFDRAEAVTHAQKTDKRLAAVQRRRIQSLQNDILRRADVAVFMSADDEQLARQAIPDLQSVVVPNGVDVEYFQPQPHVPVDPRRLVFIGTLGYFPNVDAVQYLHEGIMPQVKRLGLDVSVTIIGTGTPPDSLTKRADSNFTWVGAVDDVRPYLASAAAFIVPLRVGSGTRLKVLTAMAMGTPVISTRIGAEGINARDGESILLADTPEEFASAIKNILLMPRLRAHLTKEARELMEREYSWDRIAPVLESACIELVGKARAMKTGNT